MNLRKSDETEEKKSSEEEKKEGPPTLEDYDILRADVSAGAYGSISIAISKRKDLKVALKKMDGDRIKQFNKIESVIRERDLLFKMDHPNILKIHHAFKHEKWLYFDLEFVPNGDLHVFIERFKNVPGAFGIGKDLTRLYMA